METDRDRFVRFVGKLPERPSVRLHETEFLFILGSCHRVGQFRVYYSKDTDYYYTEPIFFGNHSNFTRHFVARFIDRFFHEFLNISHPILHFYFWRFGLQN
jgi:hypothetical protein